MRVSVWLSRLGDPTARRVAARGLLALALGGFGLTMLVLLASGRGTDRWFFVLTVWLALVFLPLWLLAAAFETLGPALRRRATAKLASRPDRYRTPAGVSLLVDALFARHVVLPRIATPLQGQKAREAAAALVVRVDRSGATQDALRAATLRCLAGVDAWVRELTGWAAQSAPENIQVRWSAVRALAALAAVSRTLLAVYEDRTGRQAWPPLDGRSLDAFADAVLDFCDDLALEVEVHSWEEPPLPLPAEPDVTGPLREAWQAYALTPPPAPAALEAFLAAALPR